MTCGSSVQPKSSTKYSKPRTGPLTDEQLDRVVDGCEPVNDDQLHVSQQILFLLAAFCILQDAQSIWFFVV